MAQFDFNGSLVASGSGEAKGIDSPFYLALSGTWTGSAALEASLDGGVTFLNCALPDGSPSAFTGNGVIAVPNVFGCSAKFRVTATITSGTLNWRLFR